MSHYLVRLIEPVFQSIEHRDSIFFILFYKIVFWLIQTFFSKLFQTFLSLSPTWQGSTEDFLSFFSQGFSLIRPVDLYTPPFVFIFMISCINSCILREFLELFKFGIFFESILFFWNWSLGFASILIYSWYMLVNLNNLEFFEQLKILGFVLNPIWGFCSIGLKLIKLAC